MCRVSICLTGYNALMWDVRGLPNRYPASRFIWQFTQFISTPLHICNTTRSSSRIVTRHEILLTSVWDPPDYGEVIRGGCVPPHESKRKISLGARIQHYTLGHPTYESKRKISLVLHKCHNYMVWDPYGMSLQIVSRGCAEIQHKKYLIRNLDKMSYWHYIPIRSTPGRYNL